MNTIHNLSEAASANLNKIGFWEAENIIKYIYC